MSIPLENLRRTLRTRLESDKQMSGAWAIVPLLPLIVTISLFSVFSALATITPVTPGPAGSAALLLTIIGLLVLVYSTIFILLILQAVMVFMLARRRNTHFSRQILLYEDLVATTKELAARKNVDVSILINNMDRNLREARLEETEKNATLWAILSIFSVGLLYASYYLMKDFYKHERREDMFIQDLLRTFYQLGIPINLPYRTSPIPDRSFVLYFVLSLITANIFSVYWIYVLVSDPNNHFRQQMLIEDTVNAQISPILSTSASPPPPPQQSTPTPPAQ